MRILPVIAIAASATVATAAIAGPVQDRYGPPRQAATTAETTAAPVYGRSPLTWSGRPGAPEVPAQRVPELTLEQTLDHLGERRPEPARPSGPAREAQPSRPLPMSQPQVSQGMGAPSQASPAAQPHQEAGRSASPYPQARPALATRTPESRPVRPDAAIPRAANGSQPPSPAATPLEGAAPGKPPARPVVAAVVSPARPASVQVPAPTPPAAPEAPGAAARPSQKSTGPGQGAVRIYSLHREYGMTPDPAPRPSPGGYVLVGPSEAPDVGSAHMSGANSDPQPF